MNIKRQTGVILIITLFIVSGYTIYNQVIVSKQTKEIKSLKSQIDDLQNEKEELEEKINELEDNLSEVQHFDNDASVKDGFSSESNGAISFTGTVYETKIDGSSMAGMAKQFSK